MIRIAILWKKGIFRRLVQTFLLVLLPVYLIGAGIYYAGMSAVKKEVSGSVQNEISYYLDNFKKEIDRIKLLQSDLINYSVLNKLSTIPESMNLYIRNDAILSLRERLYAIKSSSIYIKDVVAFLPMMDMTVSATLGVNTPGPEELETFRNSYRKRFNGFLIIKNRIFLSFLYPIEYGYGKELPPFIVSLELDENELNTALKQLNHSENSGAAILTNIKGFTVLANDNFNNCLQYEKYYREVPNKDNTGVFNVRIDRKSSLLFYKYSPDLDILLLKRIPEDTIFNQIKKYRNWLWLFSIVSLVIIVIFSFIIFKNIHKPIIKLVESFKKVEGGELSVNIKHKHDDEFSYMYKGFNMMVGNLRALIEQVYEQKILAQKAELKYLQSQINPHFLYNSFFIIDNMVENEDYENTRLFSKQLGSYFQYITRSVSDEVGLGKEVMHARTYSEIQARRFRKRVQLEFAELPEEYVNIKVPRLILQPIIENAFEHGVENKVDKGIVRVDFHSCDGMLIINIEDNGRGMSAGEIDDLKEKMQLPFENIETTGIINVHKRIRLMLGTESGVEIGCGELGGLKVSIKLVILEDAGV